MRLFIAVPVPEEVVSQCTSLQKLDGGRFTYPKDFHVTIHFFGEIPDEEVDALKERLSAASFDAFDASTDNIGVFHGKGNISVVWLGLTPVGKWKDLRIILADEVGEFMPHLTIARVKSVTDRRVLMTSLKALRTQKIPFKVDRVILFSSTLSPDGPLYKPILELPAKA